MSDEELRRNLKLLGYNPGPITEATRALYEKKLSKLRAEARRSTGSSSVSAAATATVSRRSWAGRTAHSVTPWRGSDHLNRGQRDEDDNDDDDYEEDDEEAEEDVEDTTRSSTSGTYTNSRSTTLPEPTGLRGRINPSPPKRREWVTPTPPVHRDWADPSPPKPRELVTPTPPARRDWVSPSLPKQQEWIRPAPLARTEWTNPPTPKPREWVPSAVRGDWASPLAPKSLECTTHPVRREWDSQEISTSRSRRVFAEPLSSTRVWTSPLPTTPANRNFFRGPDDPPTPWARAKPAWDSDGEGEEALIKPASRAWWHREQTLTPSNQKHQPTCRPRTLERLLSWLLAAASVALVCVFLGILFVKSAKTPEVGQMPMNCDGKEEPYCQQEQSKMVQQMLFHLYNFLAKQAGRYECGNPDNLKSKCIPVEDARQFVANATGHPPKKFDLALEHMINSNRDFGIWLRGDDPLSESLTTLDEIACLESTRPEIWLTCRLSRALATAVTNLILLFWGLMFCWCILALLKYRWRTKEEEDQAMYDMVQHIIDMVRDHYENWHIRPGDHAYVAVHHVRDTLIPLRDRKKMLPIWEKAVQYLDANESRIRTEPQLCAGEDLLVWRWTPSVKCKDRYAKNY